MHRRRSVLLMTGVLGICMTLLVAALVATDVGATDFYNGAFQAQWLQGEALAPNFWGPVATSHIVSEPYAESPQGQRTVQYFDKGRMELTDPASGAVTNGLLATELITGRVQLGDNIFQDKAPPAIPMAGDPSNPGPTYAQLKAHAGQLLVPVSSLLSSPTQDAPVTVMFGVTGEIAPFPDGANYLMANIALYDATTQHNVPRAFASYRQRVGLNTVGLAISEPFWSNPKVGGRSLLVLVQAFERRVLTYTPVNDPTYQIEMGNIGQHYYQWRHGNDQAPGATPGSMQAPDFSATVTAAAAHGFFQSPRMVCYSYAQTQVAMGNTQVNPNNC